MISVLDGGLSTTVQDRGRFGQYHIGMPPAGAMDQYSHTIGNYLVGNDADAATLEMTYKGAKLRFETDTVIALTGATMAGTLDDEPVPMWESVAVEAGQVLSMQFATEGARTYLAVAGGIDVEPLMGSRSTYTLVGMGGYEGRPLEADDSLALGAGGNGVAGQETPTSAIPSYDDSIPIRVVLGLCDYRLTDESRDELCSEPWKVDADADRVGYRLNGVDIEFEPREQPFGAGTDPSNVVDLGYPVGSIQVSTLPIVLMRDAVTGGGYATVGTVVSSDRNLLGQRRTHEEVYFESVTLDEALAARAEEKEQLEAVRSSLA